MSELTLAAQEGIVAAIARSLKVQPQRVAAAVELLDSGATVPFIARYRKEATGGLDDTQLRFLEEQLTYLRELEQRRVTIIDSIREQGKLTEELEQQLLSADSKQRLEDLYLPYKPRRRTKAQVAREAGLEPLADRLFANPSLVPEAEAKAFVDATKGISDERAALNGARDILAERFSEQADVLEALRSYLWRRADICSAVVPEKKEEPQAEKFQDYFAYREALATVPSHRALALFRGREEGVLSLRIALSPDEEQASIHPCQRLLGQLLHLEDRQRPADQWLSSVVRWTWRVKCLPVLENELFSRIKQEADEAAIRVFGVNLKDLLLAAPAGHKGVIGLDPGIRTGVKVAVISNTGAVLDTAVIYPHEPRREWEKSLAVLAQLAKKYGPQLIAIGNGTASRETEKLALDLIARHPELHLTKVVVSEAGASVYSASALAAAELPGMDVSYRGAVSIARRLQDPLAELVKIDPKSIGVGQYQHDVNQAQLAQRLDAVVEDCVNAVGVDINTASPSLLSRVAGLSGSQARAIVSWREAHGAFANRRQILAVPRLGPRTFEQAAGFLRIPNAINPLDASAVHPESYPVAERIAKKVGLPLKDLVGNAAILKKLHAQDFTDDQVGLPTVVDILGELEKPGRDPRPEFRTAKFDESVHDLSDLKPGMLLEGTVTNVAAFGAFVDIGVHQDGLVHVSELADRFVKDPREVVKVGEIVNVRVLDVDLGRKRIALSMRRSPTVKTRNDTGKSHTRKSTPSSMGAMAAAFAALRQRQ